MNVHLFWAIVSAIILLFILTHLRPLTYSEISDLAQKKRKKRIREYFIFDDAEYEPDQQFKKRMNPNGSFYTVNELLYNFPSISSSLLKYKKHEWIIIAFEKNQEVKSIWINKGFDRSSVSSYLSSDKIATIGIQNGFSSVLIFHNHPNTDPNNYDFSSPSKQDFISANRYAEVFNSNGLNLIEFICERGRHYEYFRSSSDNFYPQLKIEQEIKKLNGKSRIKNLDLHIQRLF